MPDFHVLDSKTVSGLRKILTSNFERHVATEEELAQKPRSYLNGHQIAGMVYKNTAGSQWRT